MTGRAAALDLAVPAPAWPHVTLLDHEGRSVPLDVLAGGRTVVLNFFFTTCAAICPVQTALLRQAREAAAFRAGTPPLIVSISLNPLGDTPAAIRRYAAEFDIDLGPDKGWVMLTGPEQSLAALWTAFGIAATAPQDHAPVIWVGKPSTGRWTRIAATAPPETIAGILPEFD